MGLSEQGIADHAFGPLQRFLFTRLIGFHIAVCRLDIVWLDVGRTSFSMNRLIRRLPIVLCSPS
jgi:hypothetical protein